MEQWITDYYQDVDNLRLDEYVRRHTDDVVVKFANTAVGKDQVRQAIGGFFQSIGGMRHSFINVYEEGDTAILELEIDYTRKDGGHVSVPAMSVLHRRGELVDQLRIYIDLAPVFAV